MKLKENREKSKIEEADTTTEITETDTTTTEITIETETTETELEITEIEEMATTSIKRKTPNHTKRKMVIEITETETEITETTEITEITTDLTEEVTKITEETTSHKPQDKRSSQLKTIRCLICSKRTSSYSLLSNSQNRMLIQKLNKNKRRKDSILESGKNFL